jgi:CRP/FNR family nitrogen fixation transcriptional regulator
MTAMHSIAAVATARHLPKTLKIAARKMIFEEGDVADYIYEIVRGVIMTRKLLPDGRRQIFEILRTGEFLGFSKAETHGHGAQTLSKCELRRYPQQSFLSAAANQKRLLDYLIGRRDTHYGRAVVLGRRSAAERIATFFAEFGGTGAAGEEVHVNLREMSEYLGLRPETVSRQMTQLCNASLIARSKWGTYRVSDRVGLAKIAAAVSPASPDIAMDPIS